MPTAATSSSTLYKQKVGTQALADTGRAVQQGPENYSGGALAGATQGPISARAGLSGSLSAPRRPIARNLPPQAAPQAAQVGNRAFGARSAGSTNLSYGGTPRMTQAAPYVPPPPGTIGYKPPLTKDPNVGYVPRQPPKALDPGGPPPPGYGGDVDSDPYTPPVAAGADKAALLGRTGRSGAGPYSGLEQMQGMRDGSVGYSGGPTDGATQAGTYDAGAAGGPGSGYPQVADQGTKTVLQPQAPTSSQPLTGNVGPQSVSAASPDQQNPGIPEGARPVPGAPPVTINGTSYTLYLTPQGQAVYLDAQGNSIGGSAMRDPHNPINDTANRVGDGGRERGGETPAKGNPLYDMGAAAANLIGGPIVGATDAINTAERKGIDDFTHNWEDINDLQSKGRELLDNKQADEVERSKREQLLSDVEGQRSAALRNEAARMSRGGGMRTGQDQGIYGQAMKQMQEGSRGLTDDAFKRRLASTQAGASMLSDAAGKKYEQLANARMSSKEMAAIIAQMIEAGNPGNLVP